MKLTLFKKYYTIYDSSKVQGWELIIFITKYFQFKWFTDCGEWFIYIIVGKDKKWWRFSSAGFMKYN